MKTVSKVIIGFIITGCILLGIGFAIGGYNQMSDIFHDNGNYWGWRIHGVTDIDREFDNIDNINMEIDIADVMIEEYDGTTIRVEARNVSNKMQIVDNNGTLTIKDKDGSWGFGLGFFTGGGTVTVYVPKDKEFKMVEMDVDAGKIDVAVLKTTALEVQVDAGKFIGENIVTIRGEFDVNAGKITIDSLDGQDLKFDVDAGKLNVSLVGSEQDYRYQANCDLGSVKIGSYSASGINAKDSGGLGTRTIEAKCDLGKIDIRMEG